MKKIVDLEEVLFKKGFKFIDVRSPKEYKTDTIPGSINIPLLDDMDREQVGKVYKEKGPHEAKVLGLKLVSGRLFDLVNKISSFSQSGLKPVVFCWRGGMRSHAVVTLVDLMGEEVYQLRGGYKAYRRYVNKFFEQYEVLPLKFVVLYGLTGVGKTEVLRELKKLGENVIDLEKAANNRGSVFGDIGLGTQPSQKSFESYIFKSIMNGKEDKPYFVECESKRIGRLIVPSSVYKGMQRGRKILIYASMESRINRILKDYAADLSESRKKELSQALLKLKNRLGSRKVQWLIDLVEKEKYEEVICYLLEKYYDPLYGYPSGPDSKYELCIKNENSKETAVVLRDYFNNIK
ncbi:MAG: tRNA 2-selenouridine synthase [Clostridia bacterium 41_269]|nr:MAG: tRNA 2-selenouridine synthase [Clostridia bacterium 41_269]